MCYFALDAKSARAYDERGPYPAGLAPRIDETKMKTLPLLMGTTPVTALRSYAADDGAWLSDVMDAGGQLLEGVPSGTLRLNPEMFPSLPLAQPRAFARPRRRKA